MKREEKSRNGRTKIVVILLLFLKGFAFGEDLIYKYQRLLVEKGREERIIEEKAWNEAKDIAGNYVLVGDIKKPVTIVVKGESYLDMGRRIKGLYEPDLNLVIATDYNILVHEYLHAIFYLTGEIELSKDEKFMRKIYPDA